jgi:hypothetical protein
MTPLHRIVPWLTATALAAGAALLAVHRVGTGRGSWPPFDTFGHFYPNMLHAARSLWHGGYGLLWNPLPTADSRSSP